jgi:PadR family transcriptional regulator PadR
MIVPRDPADREFRLAFWKLHILHHAEQHPVYGLWMLNELASHGHQLSPGTLYPLLARLEAHGWLRSDPADHARGRKSYRIAPAGRALLRQLRAEVDELHREMVRDRPSAGRSRAKSAPRRPS